MQIFSELNENKGLSIALGYFDGMHLGHKKVINSAVEYAKANNIKSAVITFKEHPCCYLKGVCPKYIIQDRKSKIEQLGVDYFYELNFEDKICKMDKEEYLRDVLVRYFSPSAIFTGFNHTFGVNKSGNADFLRANQQKYGYRYFETEPQTVNCEVVSSTKIRNYLHSGEIALANSMLGEEFTILSEVVEGRKVGRELGYRTANQIYPKRLVDIPFGVYEVKTKYGKGLTNFGIRPTLVNNNEPVLETHILNFDGDIYGENLEIKFIKMIRPEKKFNSADELKEQIAKDLQQLKQ